MNTRQLEEILSWLKATDLVEVSFREGEHGFSLAKELPQPSASWPTPSSRFAPVCAPALGLFQWSQPGRARSAEEGEEVSCGQALGVIELGKGKSVPVLCPAAGRLARIMVEAGSAVEFGQPLFFVEPA